MNKSLLIVLSLALATLSGCSENSKTQSPPKQPKNIILMIGDGMGPAQIGAYRIFNDDPKTPQVDQLTLDNYLVGSLATEPFDSDETDVYQVTDSAASATAYSTGVKTFNGAIGVDINKQKQQTVLELAKSKGKKVGLVATSQINHATPASFIAHVDSRKKYNEIADQFLDNRWQNAPMLDVFLGGGWQYFKREDRDLVAELEASHYQVITDAAQLMSAGDRLAGLFADTGLPAVLDRDKKHPSLAQMTEAALKRLNNGNGFFLMVEGSQIDWAGHSNNVADMVHEVDDFHQAFEAALAFAKQDRNTLVLVTADHETGGLSIGARYDDKNHYSFDPAPLQRMKKGIRGYVEQIIEQKEVTSILSELGVELTDAENQRWNEFKDYEAEAMSVGKWLIDVLNRATHAGWTSGGHTGVDVNLYAFGPGSEIFRGYHHNVVIGQTILDWYSSTTN